jgi:peroxiredoxin
LQSNLGELTKRDIGLVAISIDDVAPGKAMAAKLGLTFPVLADPKASALKAFGIFDPDTEIAWPSIFIVSRDTKIVHRWLADTFSERIVTADVMKALDKPQ